MLLVESLIGDGNANAVAAPAGAAIKSTELQGN